MKNQNYRRFCNVYFRNQKTVKQCLELLREVQPELQISNLKFYTYLMGVLRGEGQELVPHLSTSWVSSTPPFLLWVNSVSSQGPKPSAALRTSFSRYLSWHCCRHWRNSSEQNRQKSQCSFSYSLVGKILNQQGKPSI